MALKQGTFLLSVTGGVLVMNEGFAVIFAVSLMITSTYIVDELMPWHEKNSDLSFLEVNRYDNFLCLLLYYTVLQTHR